MKAKLLDWIKLTFANKSPRTIQTYSEAVETLWKKFTLELDSDFWVTTPFVKLSSNDVRRLYASWKNSKRGLAHYDRVWRAVFKRVEQEGREELGLPSEWESPWKRVEPVRVPVEEKVPLSGRQMRRLFSAIQLMPFEEDAFVRLLATTGVRVSEALGLKPEDIERGYISIVSKGGRRRLVAITENMYLYLDALRSESSDKLFNWNRQQARNIVEKAGKLIGVKLHPHLLRHSYASVMLNEKSAPLKFVQEQLGHSNVTTTMRYVHVLPEQKAELARKFAI